MRKIILLLVILLIAVVFSSSAVVVLLNNGVKESSQTLHYAFEIVNMYPHDPNAFTEGLEFHDGFLFESTGQYGDSGSSVRRVELETGIVLQSISLPEDYFGEGLTVFNNRIIQLTWLSHIGFVYDENSLQLLQNFSYLTQGWGLTNDGHQLIMSDGTASLYSIDPITFQKTGQVQVNDAGKPIVNLNELEFVQGEILANVWQTHNIVIVDPQTGQVKGWINLTGIENFTNPDPEAVLNGIAYEQKSGHLFVTGKMWPWIFEIQLVPSK